MSQPTHTGSFIKDLRTRHGLTQQQLAEKAGVGLRFIRDMEQGKETLRIDKVNQVLALFGYELIPGKELDPYQILENHFSKNIKIYFKNKSVLFGFIIDEIRERQQITGWKFVSNNNAIQYQSTHDEKLLQNINHADIERIENINT
ncbi:MAG TPA: helix-turn-helix transcriptional regulator [Chitinophagaceae bacterium]